MFYPGSTDYTMAIAAVAAVITVIVTATWRFW